MKDNGSQQVSGNGTGMAIPITSKDEKDGVISTQAVNIARLEKALEARGAKLRESEERVALYKARTEDL